MEKYIYFNGLRFVRDDKTGYYLNSKTHKRLHRYVWEFYNGAIPKGYDIHHIDHNKANNDISNLKLLSREEHMSYHSSNLTEEEKERRRENLKTNALPKACEWHKSEEGREWHKKHAQEQLANGTLVKRYKMICEVCGKEFEGIKHQRFCSNNCKSAYRRKMGFDNIKVKCVVCGKEFVKNKYSTIKCCSLSCANKLRWKKRNENQENQKD